ncbi:hypothetical protein HanIR_Chr15g0742131 [Helianthus annuus]|nr:hypothetical protein HanIR_Chr15g0742131 [Helianthus annuus]
MTTKTVTTKTAEKERPRCSRRRPRWQTPTPDFSSFFSFPCFSCFFSLMLSNIYVCFSC